MKDAQQFLFSVFCIQNHLTLLLKLFIALNGFQQSIKLSTKAYCFTFIRITVCLQNQVDNGPAMISATQRLLAQITGIHFNQSCSHSYIFQWSKLISHLIYHSCGLQQLPSVLWLQWRHPCTILPYSCSKHSTSFLKLPTTMQLKILYMYIIYIYISVTTNSSHQPLTKFYTLPPVARSNSSISTS